MTDLDNIGVTKTANFSVRLKWARAFLHPISVTNALSDVFIVNFKHILHHFLVFLLLNLKSFKTE